MNKRRQGSRLVWAECQSCGKGRTVKFRETIELDGGLFSLTNCSKCPRDKLGERHRGECGYVILILRKKAIVREGCRASKRVKEHSYIMSLSLGRPLKRNEEVHHKNGIKSDNRLGNLELRDRPHGSGQRVEDLAEHYFKLISYEDRQKLVDWHLKSILHRGV